MMFLNTNQFFYIYILLIENDRKKEEGQKYPANRIDSFDPFIKMLGSVRKLV